MFLDNLLKIIEENLPVSSAMEGDRIGLQIQSGRTQVDKVLVTLEVNDEVLNEAIHKNCDCVITFHPLIFHPLISLTNNNRVGNLTIKLIKNDIALISIHTNFDSFSEGTSKILAELLDLEVQGFLKPDENLDGFGMGIIALPKIELTQKALLEKVNSICNSPIRYSLINENIKINKIAIVGGSGTSFIKNVINSGVQAFITSDITYHRFHEVNGYLMLIDPGHYEMEQFVPKGMAKLLKEKTIDDNSISIVLSNTYTNPVSYYPDTELYKNLQKNYLLNNNMVV